MSDTFMEHTIRVSHGDGWFYVLRQSPDNPEWIVVSYGEDESDDPERSLISCPPDMARKIAKALEFLADHIERGYR